MRNLIKYCIIFVTILLTSCSGGEVKTANIGQYNTVVFEGCEYIYHIHIGERGLVHKGNCSNPIHYHMQSKLK